MMNFQINKKLTDETGLQYLSSDIKEAQEYIDKYIKSEEDVDKFVNTCVTDVTEIEIPDDYEIRDIILHHFNRFDDVLVNYQVYYKGYVAECSAYWEDGEINEDRSNLNLSFVKIHETQTSITEVEDFFEKCYSHQQDYDWWDFSTDLGNYADNEKVDSNSEWDLRKYDENVIIRRI